MEDEDSFMVEEVPYTEDYPAGFEDNFLVEEEEEAIAESKKEDPFEEIAASSEGESLEEDDEQERDKVKEEEQEEQEEKGNEEEEEEGKAEDQEMAATMSSSRGGKRKPSWEDNIPDQITGDQERDQILSARCDSLSESGSCQSPLWSDVASFDESSSSSDPETDWARLCSSVNRALEEEQVHRVMVARIPSPFLMGEDEQQQEFLLWSPPRQRRRISVDSNDPICVEVPPSPFDSKRSTPCHPSPLLSPLLSPVRSKSTSLSPSPSLVAGLMINSDNEPRVCRNIFAERSKLPANFHPHSHGNLEGKSNRSSYFSMISSAARFLFRTVIDFEGEPGGNLSLMDTSNLVQARVYRRKEDGQGRLRDCYNLHGENEHCEDCAEEYEV